MKRWYDFRAQARGAEIVIYDEIGAFGTPAKAFLDELKALGIEAIHCWPDEGHAVNCLAVRPGKVLISEGCPWTVERLNQRGVETVEIDYSEIRKNGGGIHCSTLPLIRDRK